MGWGGGGEEAGAKHKAHSIAIRGTVVRRPINANPRLKVYRGFHHAR